MTTANSNSGRRRRAIAAATALPSRAVPPAAELWIAALPAAAFAGVVAVGVTLAIERFGGKVGGLLGTLPTTIVPAALGIFARTDPEGFRAAMDATPGGMLVDAVFLWLWRAVPPHLPAWSLRARLSAMVLISLGAWAVLAVGLVAIGDAWGADGRDTLGLGVAGLALLVLSGVAATRTPRPTPRGTRRVGPGVLALRGVFAAVAIFVAVWIAAVGSPLLAGVVAVFPAIFVTTMVSLWLAQGEAVPAGAVGPMMLGASSVAAFALWARWLMPAYGPWAAGPAWLLAVATATLPAWAGLRRTP
jgi:hypothetical protein